MSDASQSAGTVKVFFSYAHEDKALCEKLQQHFSFLRREKKLVHWYDGEIKAGREWRGEIEEQLNSADVILLLISAAFAHSDFCYNIETGRAMERHNAGEAVVVPIILHPCDWRSAPFAKLQALPSGDDAISEWLNTEKALSEVARGVRRVVEDLIAMRSAKRQSDSSQRLVSTSSAVHQTEELSLSGKNDDYQPNETDRRILNYLLTGVDCDLGSIVSALHPIRADEVIGHLSLLGKHDYIKIPRLTASTPLPQYSLTLKGINYIKENPLRLEGIKPEMPEARSATPEPVPPQTQTTATPQSAKGYKPIGADVEILKLISRGISYESELIRATKMEPWQVRSSLATLMNEDFIRLEHPMGRAPYLNLTQKAIAYLNEPDYKGIPHPPSPSSRRPAP